MTASNYGLTVVTGSTLVARLTLVTTGLKTVLIAVPEREPP